MNILEISYLANGPVIDLVRWLQVERLIANPLRCVPCNQPMDLNGRNQEHIDGYIWRCSGWRRRKSLRSGSFFCEFPRVPLGKLVLLIYLWSERELRSTAARMLSLTRNTVGNVYSVLRHYCGRDLQDRPVTPFGGRVYIVKSDESQFQHKSKYQRGRRIRNRPCWVFGVLCTEYTPCKGYFQVVQRRDRDTLTQILQRVLLPGTEVHTDDWAAYRNLDRHVANVAVHRVVVHQDNFVDPLTGVHTQEAESAWARLKYHVKREKGIRGGDIQSFLNEQMWRDWRCVGNVFQSARLLLTRYYNP